MIAEYDCTGFSGHRLTVTEEEVSIAGLKIPVEDILDVVLFPIAANMRGIGGCIKFVTEDNPELPVINPRRGWDVVCRGEVSSGLDLARGNCFWFGGDYSEGGWIRQNEKAEEIASAVRGMLVPREGIPASSEPSEDLPPAAGEGEDPPQPPKKKGLFGKLLGR